MIALEKPFRYALRLSLMVGFLVRHAIFEIHLAYLGDVEGRRCGVGESVVGEEDEGSPCVACYGS
ncbi:hypothetical protein CK203_043832 [Vitis vinifera]|uniref:Uncharacterized protein n=1 Tax=Vitis vinifera TaxID=29760 RepID=A0A438HVJ5_VITVI|nr:hypothetical protein CK203_043832 [Vitis vinifera]